MGRLINFTENTAFEKRPYMDGHTLSNVSVDKIEKPHGSWDVCVFEYTITKPDGSSRVNKVTQFIPDDGKNDKVDNKFLNYFKHVLGAFVTNEEAEKMIQTRFDGLDFTNKEYAQIVGDMINAANTGDELEVLYVPRIKKDKTVDTYLDPNGNTKMSKEICKDLWQLKPGSTFIRVKGDDARTLITSDVLTKIEKNWTPGDSSTDDDTDSDNTTGWN